MAFIKLIFLLQIFCIYILNTYGIHKQSITRVDKFDLCNCPENCILQNFESQLRNSDRHNTLMYLKFTLTQDVSNIKLVAVIQKCKNKDTLDSCESISPLNSAQACTILKIKNVMWSPIVESFTPHFKCPLRKGTYVSENGSFDADMYKVLPLHGWYYKVRLDLYNGTGTNLLWSFCLDFEVVRVNVF